MSHTRRARKLYPINANTSVAEIQNISHEYTGVSVQGIASVECAQAIPKHAYEIEVLNPDAIRFLRTLPRHVHTLVVSHQTHPNVLKPFSRSINRVRIKDTFGMNSKMDFHQYITKVTYPDGHVEYPHGESSSQEQAEPSKSITTTKTKTVNRKEKTTESTPEKTIEREVETTIVTTKEKHISSSGSLSDNYSRKRKRDEESEDEKGVNKAEPENKRQKLDKPEKIKKPDAMELSDDSDMEGLDVTPEKRAVPLSKEFDIFMLSGRTPVSDIKASTCSTALLLSEGAKPQKLKQAIRFKRFEFGADIDGSIIHEFPGVSQVKLFHGVTTSTAMKLKATIKWVVLSKRVEGEPGEAIFDDWKEIKDKKEAKRIGLQQTIHLINALMERLDPRIAVSVEESIKPLTKLQAVDAGVVDVEINQYTTIKTVRKLAGLGVHAVWLGRNVAPEVVAAIPDDIQNVVVGLDVCAESVAAIAKNKSVTYADGVNMSLYDDLFDQMAADILEEESNKLKIEQAPDTLRKLFDEVEKIEVDQMEDDLINKMFDEKGLFDFADMVVNAAPQLNIPAPLIQVPVPGLGFFQPAQPPAPRRAGIFINLASDDEDDVVANQQPANQQPANQQPVNQPANDDDDVIFVREVAPNISRRTRSNRR